MLRSAYRERNKLIGQRCDGNALFSAERELQRVHQLIARHRVFCAQCKLNLAGLELSLQEREVRSSVVPVDRTG
jgi:hypothetical protein